jgi:formylglycine-generating enzyme required for sulfatase activity
MGNVWEWMESPWYSGDYGTGSNRGLRGGDFYYGVDTLASSGRFGYYPGDESLVFGFRVASEVPEPMSVTLLSLGGVALLKRRTS